MTTSNSSVWQDTPEELELVAKANSGNGNKLENMVMQEGENVVRVVGKYHFIPSHWFNKIKRSAICPGLKDCPVCTNPIRTKLEASAREIQSKFGKGSKEAVDAWKKFFSYDRKPTYVVNVVDRRDGKMKIWKFSYAIKQLVAKISEKYPLDATDLIITRTGTGLKTRYSVIPAPISAPLSSQEQAQKPFVLETIYRGTTLDTLNAYLRGEIPAPKARNTTTSVTTTSQEEPGPEIANEVPDLSDLGTALDDTENL